MSPSAGIENHQDFAVAQFVDRNSVTDHIDTIGGINEVEVGRSGMAVDDFYIFAQGLKNLSHAKFTSKSIAIGADVAGQNETFVGIDDVNKR